MTNGGVQDGSRDGEDDEGKCSIRLNLVVGCWKKTTSYCPELAGIAVPSRTTKIHCSYHQIHFHSEELLSRFHCFLNSCRALVVYTLIHSVQRRTQASSLNRAMIAEVIGSLGVGRRTHFVWVDDA